MVHVVGTNISIAQVRYAPELLKQLAHRNIVRIYALSGKNKILLGGFVSITAIQAITGVLLTAIPSSSGEPFSPLSVDVG